MVPEYGVTPRCTEIKLIFLSLYFDKTLLSDLKILISISKSFILKTLVISATFQQLL